jgi:hypothetical protein
LNGCDCCEGRQSVWGAFVVGLGVFTLGAILLLNDFGVIDGDPLVPYWPVLLIVLGISYLVGSSSVRKTGWGLSWIAVGAIILLNNTGVIAVGIGVLWPVVVVILGANILFRGARRRHRCSDDGSDIGSTPAV